MPDYQSVVDAIPRIRRACRPLFESDPAGGPKLTPHQARVLAFLDERDPAMVGELAEHLGVTASTMSLTLKRLEGAGYVTRDRDPQDRRVTNVRLTRAGGRARDARRDLDPERVERMLAMLSPADRSAALRGVAVLAAAADLLVRRERDAMDAQLRGDPAPAPTPRGAGQPSPLQPIRP
jgi:DNA-binding MarR family transcriptional regulator